MAQSVSDQPCETTSLNGLREIVDIQIAHLENQILALTEQARKLRSRRNDLANVSQIPEELLAHIFNHHKQDVQLSSGAQRTMSWMSITNVCSRWRSTAIEDQRLWSDIDSKDSQDLIVAKLQRSKGAPLGLAISDQGHESPPLLQPIRDLLFHAISQPRVKRLSLSTTDEGLLVRYLKHLPLSLPVLEELWLETPGLSLHPCVPISSLLGERALNLRLLSLTRCNIRLDSQTVRHRLTDFRFKRHHVPVYIEDTLEVGLGLLEALADMPNLIRVELDFPFAEIVGAPGDTDRTISLSRLERIILRDVSQRYDSYMERFQLPISACIATHFTQLSYDTATTADILTSSWLSRPGKPSEAPPSLKTLAWYRSGKQNRINHIYLSKEQKITIPTPSEDGLVRQVGPGSILYSFEDNSIRTLDIDHSIPSLLLSKLPLNEVCCLSLSGTDGSDTDWRLLTPLLERIVIWEKGKSYAFQATESLFRNGPHTNQPVAPWLPHLQFVTIHGSSTESQYRNTPDGAQAFTRLVNSLVQFVQSGGALQELRFEACRGLLQAKDYQRLKAAVHRILWNGEVI